MSFLDSLGIIGELERQFDVNAVQYEGTCVWPVIRNALAATLENPHNPTFRTVRNGQYNLWSYVPDPVQLRSLEKHRGVDFLFWTRWNEYRTKIRGLYYGLSDPYLETVKDEHRTLKIELDSGRVQATSPRYYPTEIIKLTQARIPCPVGHGEIHHFQSLRQQVLSQCSIDMDEGIILEILHNTEQYRMLFLDLLFHIQPRVVSLVCYYTCPMAMGLIRACRDLGIATVELQHGIVPQSPYYERWTRIPDGGYEYLPDWFYVWGDLFRDAILALRPNGCRHHRPIVGPHEMMRKSLQEPGSGEDRLDPSFGSELGRRNKTILVTLEYPADGIPAHVLEAMRIGPRDWLWLLRCHPRFRDQKQPFLDLLSRSGIENYEIEKATDQPLFELLKSVHAHLTSFSSVCIESLRFGVPSLLYGSTGFEIFGEYIRKGFLGYEPESAEKLLQWLSTPSDPELIQRRGEQFFAMEPGLGRRVFEAVLNDSTLRPTRLDSQRYRVANLNRLGQDHLRHGNLPAAIEFFSSAIRFQPQDPEAYRNLADVSWKMGDCDQARLFVEAAQEIDPSDSRTGDTRERIQRAQNTIISDRSGIYAKPFHHPSSRVR